MIVATDRLEDLPGPVSMVDGGFDPLHPGHVEYFAAAAALGLPVLCNVSSDDWVRRKHPPLLLQQERGAVIDAIRHVAYTHLSSTATADVLGRVCPRFYVKGADWLGKLPPEEQRVCTDRGIEVVYLDTVISSSTALLERFLAAARGSA